MNRRERRAAAAQERREQRRKPTTDDALRAARISAAVGGCTCTPTVSLRPLGRGVTVAAIAHDEGCGHKRCPDGCRCAFCRLVEGPAATQNGGAA